jgi:hypothetical protein
VQSNVNRPFKAPAIMLERGESEIRAQRQVVAAVIFAALISFFVYRPDRRLPFDVIDFSEFVPLLKSSPSASEQLAKVVAYYAGHGRVNVVGYLFVLAKWNIWDANTVAWQWLRFGTMWLIIALTFLLLRRLGASLLGAFMGATVFLFAPAAAAGWIHLTAAEPLGTVILLVMCILALSDHQQWTDHRLAVALGLLTVLLLLTKEILGVTLVLPLLLAAATLTKHGSPRPSRRLAFIASGLSLGALLSLVPIVTVAIRARSDSYASEFGKQFRPATDAIAAWIRGLTPFDPFASIPGLAQGLLDVAFLGLLVVGWRVRADGVLPSRRSLLWGLLLFPLLIGIVYLPWPVFASFYALPALLSLAIVVGIAVTGVQATALRSPGVIVWLMCLMVGAMVAANDTSRTAAGRRLQGRAAELVSRASVDSIYVASPRPSRLRSSGLATILVRYGSALGMPMPEGLDVNCAQADSLSERLPTRSMLLTYNALHFVHGSLRCPIPHARILLEERFTQWRWSRLPVRYDSFYVEAHARER